MWGRARSGSADQYSRVHFSAKRSQGVTGRAVELNSKRLEGESKLDQELEERGQKLFGAEEAEGSWGCLGWGWVCGGVL